MRHPLATLVIVALLAVAMSQPVLARKGGSASSSGRAAHASAGTHAGAHSRAGNYAQHRRFAGPPRAFVFLAAPMFAAAYPAYLYPPAVGYAPPPPLEYIEQPRAPDVWYFCPESDAYFPYVQQCPGGWQQVAPQPPATGQ